MVTKEEALKAHMESKGKVESSPKVRLANGDDLAKYYTPGVAYVCQEINADKSKAYDYTNKGNTIAIISDGTRILGLGNIGPEAGLPVMESKALLFKKLAGIDAMPLCLNTTDENEIVNFAKHISPSIAGINIEDIESPKCFSIAERLSNELQIPILHDDQHGTALVAIAGVMNALNIAGKNLKASKIVVNGAGAAGLGISRMFGYMKMENIYVLDSNGLIYRDRQEHMNKYKDEIARITNGANKSGMLSDIIENADILIGASKANAFSKEIISKMNEKPIVFALANPDPEIPYAEAMEAGAFIAATGRSDAPNQVNNMLSFPAVMRGLLDSGASRIDYSMLYNGAKALARSVGKRLARDHILPSISEGKELSKAISDVAIAIADTAIKSHNARSDISSDAIKSGLASRARLYKKMEKLVKKP